MYKSLLFALLLGAGLSTFAQAQRRLTEATLAYTVYLDATTTDTTVSTQTATTICYLKGINSRTDLVTPVGKQSTIYLAKTEQVILLKEYGNQRYMTRLTRAQWEKSNSKYREATLDFQADTLRIAGYLCSKVIATLKDSSSFTIWYTRELIPLNKTFLPLANLVPGLILSFETLVGDNKVLYQIDQLLFNPVQQMLFDIPETGYRLLDNK
jgi:hypothetical protein